MDNNLNLTKEDYENLKKLFFISYKIKWAYDNLAMLEINNKKDTEEFTKWTNYLQTLLELETQIYNIIGKSPKKISDMLCYILESEPYNLTDVLIYLNNDEDEELKDEDELEKLEEELGVELTDEKIEEMEKEFFYQAKVDLMMEQDVINTILTMLKNYLDNPAFANIRDSLIKFKYKMAFAFKFVEKDFLTSNFNFKDTLFWQTKMYTDTNNKNGNEDLKESKNSYAYDLLYEQYGYLLEMFYENETDKNKLAQAIMIEIFVRCGLVFADEEVAGSFILMMESEISYLEENNVHNEKAKDFIFKSFSHIDEDKCLPNILSFRL